MTVDLPNLLTVLRIVAILPLAALVAAGADIAAALLFAVAAATDWLDGFLARRRGRSSAFGRMLDPIADKLLVAATLLLLAGHDRLSGFGLAAALAILLREILVAGLREHLAAEGGVAMPVTLLAKWKTAAQLTALGLLLATPAFPLQTVGEVLLGLAAALTLWTGWDYCRIALRHVADGEARP